MKTLLAVAFLTVVIFAITNLTGCKAGCAIEETAAKGLSLGVSSALKCVNTSEVEKDIAALIGKAGLCETVSTRERNAVRGVVGDWVCPLVVAIAISQASEQIPASWGCDPSQAQGTLSDVLKEQCSKIPF